MKIKIFLILICIMDVVACTAPKDARLLKKSTKNWRESSVVLEAYADTPFSGIFLTLRENGKFEHTSSGLLKSFDAGNWTTSQDTINLSYMDSRQMITSRQKVYIDRGTSTLVFDRKDTIPSIRLRIMLNKL